MVQNYPIKFTECSTYESPYINNYKFYRHLSIYKCVIMCKFIIENYLIKVISCWKTLEKLMHASKGHFLPSVEGTIKLYTRWCGTTRRTGASWYAPATVSYLISRPEGEEERRMGWRMCDGKRYKIYPFPRKLECLFGELVWVFFLIERSFFTAILWTTLFVLDVGLQLKL